MSDDIVEWLIDFSEATNNPRCADAADKIIGISSANRRLRAENERLREALKPFAEALKDNYYHQVDELPIIAGSNQMDIRFNWTLGDLRAAAAAIKDTDNGSV